MNAPNFNAFSLKTKYSLLRVLKIIGICKIQCRLFNLGTKKCPSKKSHVIRVYIARK